MCIKTANAFGRRISSLLSFLLLHLILFPLPPTHPAWEQAAARMGQLLSIPSSHPWWEEAVPALGQPGARGPWCRQVVWCLQALLLPTVAGGAGKRLCGWEKVHALQSTALSGASVQKSEPAGILERVGKSTAQTVSWVETLRSGKRASGLGPDPVASAIFWHGGFCSSQLLQPTYAAPSLQPQ